MDRHTKEKRNRCIDRHTKDKRNTVKDGYGRLVIKMGLKHPMCETKGDSLAATQSNCGLVPVIQHFLELCFVKVLFKKMNFFHILSVAMQML